MLTHYIFVIDPREIPIEVDSQKLTNDYQIDINPTTKAGVGKLYEYIISN